MTTLVDYADLPAKVRAYLAVLADFIGEVDGKETVISTDENTCIDDGTIDAEDAVKAFNAIVKHLRTDIT